jgi:hypothetical protein
MTTIYERRVAINKRIKRKQVGTRQYEVRLDGRTIGTVKSDFDPGRPRGSWEWSINDDLHTNAIGTMGGSTDSFNHAIKQIIDFAVNHGL